MTILLRKLLLLILFISVSNAFSQTTTSSPYSRFGIGTLQKNAFQQSLGMGGLSAGLNNPIGINFANPASYAGIKLTTFELNATGSILRLSNSTASQINRNVTLSYFAFAFPLSSKGGLSFGLVPFSNVGYKVRNASDSIANSSRVNYIYSGEGGLSQFYIGAGHKITKNFTVGINANYIFGSINQSRSTEFPVGQNFLNNRTTTSLFSGGILLKYGAQYVITNTKKNKLTFGYAGNTRTKINSKLNTTNERYTSSVSGFETVVDVTIIDSNKKGEITLPTSHNIGFIYEKPNQLLIGADFSLNNWSEYRVNDKVDASINNNFNVTIGAQYTPDFNAVGKYLKTVDYRAGISFGTSYLKIRNTQLNERAFSLGAGFPLPSSNNPLSFSKVNIGVEFSERGQTSNSLVREQNIMLNLGFVLNTRWFIQRKYE